MKKIMLVLMFMFFIISCDNGERTVMNVKEDQNITESLDEDPDTNILDEEFVEENMENQPDEDLITDQSDPKTDQDFPEGYTPDEDIPEEECPVGSVNCECYGNGTCDGDLVCNSGKCTEDTPEECQIGSVNCECYGNGTCDEGLVCNLDHCEPIPEGDRFSIIDAEDNQHIIIDNDTGLTWGSHSWYQNGGIANPGGYINGGVKNMCTELNSIRFGGFSDWRNANIEDYITIMNPTAKNRLKDCNLPTQGTYYDSLEDMPYIESDCRLSGLNAMDYIFYDVFKENFPDLTKWKNERPPYVAGVGYFVDDKPEMILLSPTEGFFIQVEKGVSLKAPIYRMACVR